MEHFEQERQEWLSVVMSEADIFRIHFGTEKENGKGGDYRCRPVNRWGGGAVYRSPSKRTHLIRHNGKTPAMRPRPRRLHRGI